MIETFEGISILKKKKTGIGGPLRSFNFVCSFAPIGPNFIANTIALFQIFDPAICAISRGFTVGARVRFRVKDFVFIHGGT